MEQIVRGYSYEYVHRHGHYIAIRGYGELELQPDPIDERMLSVCLPARLLPIRFEQTDGHYVLYYEYTSKKMLSQWLRGRELQWSEWSSIMLQIVSALKDSKTYMLLEQRFVLSTDFIFIDPSGQQVYLTYLPVHYLEESDPNQAFSRLAQELLDCVDENYQNGLDHLRAILTAPDFIYTDFVSEMSRSYTSTEKATSSRPALLHETHSVLADTQEVPSPRAREDIKGDHQSEVLQGKPRFIAWIVVVLFNVMVWRTYLEMSGNGLLSICAGLTLLSLDAVYTLQKIEVPAFLRRDEKKTPEITDKRWEHIEQSVGTGTLQSQLHSTEQPTDTGRLRPMSVSIEPQPIPLDRTVLLSDYNNMLNEKPLPFIEVHNIDISAETERHTLADTSIIVGREPGSGIGIVIRQVGISRVHCEFIRKDSGFSIRDLGSVNGTFLNEQPLASYQLVPLKDGDIVRLVRSELVYRLTPSIDN